MGGEGAVIKVGFMIAGALTVNCLFYFIFYNSMFFGGVF